MLRAYFGRDSVSHTKVSACAIRITVLRCIQWKWKSPDYVRQYLVWWAHKLVETRSPTQMCVSVISSKKQKKNQMRKKRTKSNLGSGWCWIIIGVRMGVIVYVDDVGLGGWHWPTLKVGTKGQCDSERRAQGIVHVTYNQWSLRSGGLRIWGREFKRSRGW